MNKKYLKNLISAMQFLTIIPVGKPEDFDPKGIVPLFPVAGIIIGIMLSLFDMVVTQLWPGHVAALLDVIFLIFITGALHADGLGDTADGLYGQRPRDKALSVMKDSRIGVMGLVAIVCGLSVKWGGISSLDAHRSLFLAIIPAYARGSMIFGFRFLEYGRPEGGTGHAFFENDLKLRDFQWLLIPVFLSLFAGWKGVWVNFVFFATTALILFYYKKRMGCITGDMFGAMSEVTESVLFLMVCIRGVA